MNPEFLKRMTDEELEAYAGLLGMTVRAAADPEAKRALIEERRGRCAEVRALGVTVRVPAKALSDKRVTDILSKARRTEEELDEAFRLMLGAEQQRALVLAATDADGTVDGVALGLAYATILDAPQLKNS